MFAKRILAAALVLCALLGLAACAAEPEPHALLQLTVKESAEGTLSLDKTELWEKEEEVTLTVKANEGYAVEAINFYDEYGALITASYPEMDEYVLQPDGSYKVSYAPAQFYHVHEEGEEEGDIHEGESLVTQGRVQADFISESAPTTTVAQEHPHSQISVFPQRCEPGTNVMIVIALDKGYEVTHCDHNGIAFPVEEPLATYSDAQYDYVSFSFYIKDADEVVTYEIAEK